jgi:hypothetical protein
MNHDKDLRDPQLTSLLRNEPHEVPKSWIEDALGVPDHVSIPAVPEPWLVTFAPHLGALFIIGSAAWALFHPAGREMLFEHLPRFQDPLLMLAGLLTPLLMILCERGFRRFRL